MDISKLKRDPEKIHENLQELDDGSVVTKKGCKILIPGRFVEKQLAIIGGEVHTLGIFCIVVEDLYYGVSLANAMMRIEPDATNSIIINDEEYIEFVFEAGSTVISSVDLVKSDTLLYHINDEIIAKGRIPWYMDYNDVGSLFDSAEHHAGVKLGANHAILEMIAAAVARDPDDPRRFYRQVITSYNDLVKKPPVFVAFRNVALGASNTTAKLMGSYFDEALTSALVNPAEKLEDIEELLRR